MAENIRVIVADDNEITREMIVDCLSDDPQIDVVGQASDGREAIRLIKLYNPDVVLLDLVMPMADGIGVMETVSDEMESIRRPRFIIVSAAGSEEIVNHALRTGAAYFIMKPFDGEALIKRIKRTCNDPITIAQENLNASPTVEQMVVALLRDIGVSVGMVGYKYLKSAIILAISDPDALTAVTKFIYPVLASKHGSSPNNVERNIRYAIESSWTNTTDEKHRAFQNELFSNKKPTNSEFINICAEKILFSLK